MQNRSPNIWSPSKFKGYISEIREPTHDSYIKRKELTDDLFDFISNDKKENDEICRDIKNTVKLLGKGGFGEVFLTKYDKKEIAVKKIKYIPSVSNVDIIKKGLIGISDIDIGIRFFHNNVAKTYLVITPDVCPMEKSINLILQLHDTDMFNTKLDPNYNTDKNNDNIIADIEAKFKICVDAIQGLAFLNRNGILCIDISPDNVLIDLPNEDLVFGRGYISDFGLSKRITEGSFSVIHNGLVGKPEYNLTPRVVKQYIDNNYVEYNQYTESYSLALSCMSFLIDYLYYPYIYDEILSSNNNDYYKTALYVSNDLIQRYKTFPDNNKTLMTKYGKKYKDIITDLLQMSCNDVLEKNQLIGINYGYVTIESSDNLLGSKNDYVNMIKKIYQLDLQVKVFFSAVHLAYIASQWFNYNSDVYPKFISLFTSKYYDIDINFKLTKNEIKKYNSFELKLIGVLSGTIMTYNVYDYLIDENDMMNGFGLIILNPSEYFELLYQKTKNGVDIKKQSFNVSDMTITKFKGELRNILLQK